MHLNGLKSTESKLVFLKTEYYHDVAQVVPVTLSRNRQIFDICLYLSTFTTVVPQREAGQALLVQTSRESSVLKRGLNTNSPK